MEQFIQYLYEYENGERVRNLGFMKVENKMDKTDVQIYAKQLDEVFGIWFKKPDGSCYIAAWEDPGECRKELIQPRVEEKTAEEESEAAPYIPPSNRRFEKIQRQDLSRLPRKEWRLANNNFLLHGFYNYHHLLYIEDEGKVWIGVPGIYHERERMAAENFGFPEFIRLTDYELELTEEEKNTAEDFGYWCRQVEHF